MPLVPAVTELMVAELLYLEKQGGTLPIEMMINSSGTTRQDGEILAFDSEGIAVTSTMGFVRNPISTVNMGLCAGWAAVVLAFGKKGWRKSLPHSLAMIQQPRVPPTGQRQAVEVHIKWREVLDFKRELLRMLSIGTGWDVEKLDKDMQRPLYMRPRDALEYGIIDEIIQPNQIKHDKAVQYWLKSGRAESEGRLEQWAEYLQLQEQYALKDHFRKSTARAVRDTYRTAAQELLGANKGALQELEQGARERLPADMLTEEGEVRLPFSRQGLKAAILNSERYARRSVERQMRSGKVQVPAEWTEELVEIEAKLAADAVHEPAVDYAELIRRIEVMDAQEFAQMDVSALVSQYSATNKVAA